MSDKKLKWIVPAVVIAVSVFTAFWGLTSEPLGDHEAYVAVTARQMVNSGNWLVPYFNGQPRLNKTPLNYWLTAIGAKAAESVNVFATRLPNAALAVLSAVAIFYFVSEWFGRRIAFLSSLIWSTSLCYVRYSHLGRPEMSLTVFVTIAMLAFYSAIKSQSRTKQVWYAIIFWVSFSLAMLAKGPAPLPLMAPALFLYFAIFRRWKFIPKLLPIAGTILFLLIVLPWPIAVLLKAPQAVNIWKMEYLNRAAGEYAAGSKPFYYYFYIMFVYLLPFSAFIPLALAAPFYRVWEKKRDAMFYLWLWFVVGIITMTLCGGKRQHYILPLMPAMAIMAGVILEDMIFVNKAYTIRFSSIFWAGHLLAVFLTAAGAIIWMRNRQYPEQFLTLGTVIPVVAILFNISVLFWLNKKVAATISIFAIFCMFILLFPVLEFENGEYIDYDFARRVSTILAGRDLFAYCQADASFIYYLGRNVPVIHDVNEIYEKYSAGSGVVAAKEPFKQLKKDGRLAPCIYGLDRNRCLFINEK